MIGTGIRGIISARALGRLDVVAGDPDDVGAGPGQGIDLSQGAVDVGGLGGAHGLHASPGHHRPPAPTQP